MVFSAGLSDTHISAASKQWLEDMLKLVQRNLDAAKIVLVSKLSNAASVDMDALRKPFPTPPAAQAFVSGGARGRAIPMLPGGVVDVLSWGAGTRD